MGTIRSFIAVELTDDVRQSLGALQQALLEDTPRGAVRWVQSEKIHLTLKFLGDIDPVAVEPIGRSLQGSSEKFEPFRLHLGRLGCFPNPRKPRVIWVGVDGDVEMLITLQRTIESGLAKLGYPAENRRFHPHLTLGRVKDPRKVIDARYPWGEARAAGQLPVREICLFESDLRPTGAVYTALRRATLAGDQQVAER